jgi:hypothetical protein
VTRNFKDPAHLLPILLFSVECVKRADRINQRGACIDTDRDSESLGDLFPGCAILSRGSAMNGNAAIASQADCGSQGNQFAGFCIDVTASLRSAA